MEKKIDLFIVEGPSDEEYLHPLKKYMESQYGNALKFRITRGDICQKISFNHRAVVINRIHEHVETYLQEYHLSPKDVRRIIHVVDIDGVSIPIDKIIEDKSLDGIIYYRDHIEVIDKNSIIKRNKNKEKILKLMSSYSQPISFKVKNAEIKIPYCMYFFSQNIDDVLSDKLNSTDEEKENDSLEFAAMYKNNFTGFKNIIYVNGCIHMTRTESWNYILSGDHALEKKTNLNLLIDEYIANTNEDA